MVDMCFLRGELLPALETATSKPLENFFAADRLSPLTGNIHQQAAAICTFAVLFGKAGRVLQHVVALLADPAFTLAAGFSPGVTVEVLKGLKGVAKDAVLIPSGLLNV